MSNYDGDEYRIEPDDGTCRVNPGYGKPRFSRHELKDITISVLVLALAFAILSRSGSVMNFFEYHLGEGTAYLGLFGLCIGLVVLSFLFHEFGHKFVAQKAGMWSEFRMSPMGLVLTLVTSFLGFLFAAPGAVYIQGNCSRETDGKISIAGPMVNIVLSAIGIIGCLTVNHSGWVIFFLLLANLNAFLALFNLLPIPPLDGSKVIRWNKLIWIAALAISAAPLYELISYLSTTYSKLP